MLVATYHKHPYNARMKLLFIRHGQTDYNKMQRPQGRGIDASLNAEGIQQVESALENIPNDIDIFFSSPLKRAAESAEILNRKLKLPIKYHDDLVELSYGSLAGKTWPEIEAETGDAEVHQKDRDSAFDYRNFGGDSAEDMKQRVQRFVAEMKKTYPKKTVLVATHGGVIGIMHILFPQKEMPETGNATIHTFEFE